MAAALAFEVTKLYKRPAVWILAIVLLLSVPLLNYLENYLFYESLRQGDVRVTGGRAALEQVERFVLPASLPVNVASFSASFDAPIALVLGASAVVSEYGWDTLKTALTQGLGRPSIFACKVLAVGLVLASFALLAFGAGAVASYAAATVLEAPVEWPPIGDVAKGFGFTCLFFGAWACLGVLLAVLVRGTALAIGLGLIYALVVEGLILGFSERSDVFEAFGEVLLSRNSASLAASLGGTPDVFGVPNPIEPTQAALVLTAYVVVGLLLSVLVFWRREVA